MKITRLPIVLLVLATGAFAQDNNATKLALAREAIAALHADKMFDGMAVQMKQMATQMAGLPADATPEQRRSMAELQGKIMDLSMESAKALVTKMDQVYAAVFTEAELKAIVVFYSSPEGQSMVAKQPQVMAHVMPLVQEMQRELMPKIKQLVEESKAAGKAAAAPAPEAKTPAAPVAGK